MNGDGLVCCSSAHRSPPRCTSISFVVLWQPFVQYIDEFCCSLTDQPDEEGFLCIRIAWAVSGVFVLRVSWTTKEFGEEQRTFRMSLRD